MKKPIRVKPPPKQPKKCKGCIYGRWEGTVQFCSKQKCIKEEWTFREWEANMLKEDAEFIHLSHELRYAMYQGYRDRNSQTDLR